MRRMSLSLLTLVAKAGLTLFGLLLVTFLIARVVPIDPVLAVVGDRASPETYRARARRDGARPAGLRCSSRAMSALLARGRSRPVGADARTR